LLNNFSIFVIVYDTAHDIICQVGNSYISNATYHTRRKDKPKLSNADWRSIYSALEFEIKARHYSGATLRSYFAAAETAWGMNSVRKGQMVLKRVFLEYSVYSMG
jgi:hypothetical protein